MYYYILNTHKFAALLYVLYHTVRVGWMLFKPTDSFSAFRKSTRIIEILLSSLFVLTGLYLIFNNMNAATLFFWIKMVTVFGSIPVAVIAFKRGNKALAVLSWLMIVMAYGLAEMNKKKMAAPKDKTDIVVDENAAADKKMEAGKQLYMQYCTRCHGDDGKLMMAGAKDLSISTLVQDEAVRIISNGKNAMPAFSNNDMPLNKNQVDAVTLYIQSLRH